MSNFMKLAFVAGVFAAGSFAVATPAMAGKYSTLAAAAQHYADCVKWMGSDQAKHAQFCSPGHDVFVSASTVTGGGTGPAPVYEHCSPPPPPRCGGDVAVAAAE